MMSGGNDMWFLNDAGVENSSIYLSIIGKIVEP